MSSDRTQRLPTLSNDHIIGCRCTYRRGQDGEALGLFTKIFTMIGDSSFYKMRFEWVVIFSL